MQKELEKIIDGFSSNVIGIGTEKKLIDSLNKNKNITECNIINNKKTKTNGKGRSKYIYIKKLRKVFKKKKVDYILCNYEVIKPYLKHFVKDSIYINRGKLYFYGSDIEIDNLLARYKRYNIEYKITNNILEIDNKLSKNNFIKDCFYYIIDSINNVIDFIGNLLMN